MVTIMNDSFLTRINNDVNSNPRYVAHFLKFNNDFGTAKMLARLLGGKEYRARSYGGGLVFQSYANYLALDIVCMKHIYDSIDLDFLTEYDFYNAKKSTGVNLENVIKAEKQGYLVDGRLTSGVCESWLRGCPSLINNEFSDHEILKLLQENGIEVTEYNSERLVKLYWESCGDALFKLCGSKL